MRVLLIVYNWEMILASSGQQRHCSTSYNTQDSPSHKKSSAPKISNVQVGKLCPRGYVWTGFVHGWAWSLSSWVETGPTVGSSKCQIARSLSLGLFSSLTEEPARCSPGGSMPGHFSLFLCHPGLTPIIVLRVFIFLKKINRLYFLEQF